MIPKGRTTLRKVLSKGNHDNNKKAKDEGAFKGKSKFSLKVMEAYLKDNKCFKYGENGVFLCLKRNERRDPPRALTVQAPKEDGHCKGIPLSYAWGKVREHNALILFDPSSIHNFISQ